MGAPIVARDVRKVLGGDECVANEVIKGVSLEIGEGEFVAITGPSGSGKSTLLYLLGLLDRPTSGEVRFELMGIGEQADKRPNQLSGGQQQRVAIARTMANRPRAIFGDEPTGNLDTKNSQAIFDVFEKLNRQRGQTLVVVTHDRELATRAHRIIQVRDGVIEQ